MIFVETRSFTTRIGALLEDDDYRILQRLLAERPDSGRLIQASGGLRKIRWAGSGRGKRGGVRVIYYWYRPGETILMLFAFAKNERDDLSTTQKAALRRVVEQEYP